MAYRSESTRRNLAGREFEVITLAESSGDRAEIWPGLGCNCLLWHVAGRDLVHAADPAELLERPTRAGIPILFPFPNRIREGSFIWRGRPFQLPRNDATKNHAIHGFSPRNPWRVLDHHGSAEQAWLRAEFQISRDAPACREFWPADARITLTISLSAGRLRFLALVENPDLATLPFGLGYHPYFDISPHALVQCPARARWQLDAMLPTGHPLELDAGFDLRAPRPTADLRLDDIYTDFPDPSWIPDGLVERAALIEPELHGRLTLRSSPAFRDLVLFTPPWRPSICLEPYTCPTDALHWPEPQSVGWMSLTPRQTWQGVVEYAWAAD